MLAIALGVGQLQVERERGFEVGKGLGHQGDAVVAFAGQAFEFKFCDHRAGFPVGAAHCARVVRAGAAIHSNRPQRVADKGVRRAKQARSDGHGGRLTPGPGSPVRATCDEHVVNEHSAQV